MDDLWSAIAIMFLVCLGAGLLTSQVAYARNGQWNMLGLALSALGLVYFLLYAAGQLYWAHWIPHSAAIVYSNFACVFAAMAAGWAWRLPGIPAWRRATLSSLLALASVATLLWPVLAIAVRPPPDGGAAWHNGVMLQTSWATCSPAAAATLLQHLDIDVTEAEMIPLCLTDSSGTPTLGLYRGVKLMSERHGRVTHVMDASLEELMQDDRWPVLLAVELPYGTEDPRYANEWGWIPGLGHSVVAIGTTPDGSVLIADPSVGLEQWSRRDLEILWHGDGIRVQ